MLNGQGIPDFIRAVKFVLEKGHSCTLGSRQDPYMSYLRGVMLLIHFLSEALS